MAGLTTVLVLVLAVAVSSAVNRRPALAHPRPTTGPGQFGPPVPEVVTADRPLPAGASVQQLRSGPDGYAHLVLHGAAMPPAADPQADLREDIVWGQAGRLRGYRIVVPHGLPRSAPLVIALPGYMQGRGLVQRQQQWARQAVIGRFIAVYAAGYDGSWNAGLCCGSAASNRVDDVGYLDALLTRVRATHVVDPRRVYLAGFSNGGMMAHRYACERAGAVAAIVSVAGPLETFSCEPSQAVAVLQVQGLVDRTVPVGGVDYSGLLKARLRSAAGTVRVWRDVDGSAAPARLVLRPGLGHAWPVDGTALAWAFFAANPQR